MNVRVTILLDVVAQAAIDAHDPQDAPDTDAATSFDARILTLEQPWMDLIAHVTVETGAALRIDSSDAVWLGEVEQCEAWSQRWR